MTNCTKKVDLYQLVFNKSNIVMLIVDCDDLKLIDQNDAALAFYGYDKTEFSTLRWADLVAPSTDGFIDAINFNVSDASEKRCKNILKSGDERDVELQISPIEYDRRTVMFITVRDITESLKQETEQRKTLEMLQLMIDTLPNPIYCKDRDARYIFCNLAFERFFGKRKEQVYGMTSHELTNKEYADKYHIQDLNLIRECEEQISQIRFPDTLKSEVKLFLKNRDPIEYEVQMRNASGKLRDVLICKDIYINTELQAGIIGILIDITERKSKEEELRMLHTALEGTPELIVTMDFNWRATYLNHSFSSLLGYELNDVNGDNKYLKKMFTELLPESDIYLITCGVKWPILEGEGQITGKSGNVISVSFRLTPIIDRDNNYKGILAVITDMSEALKEKEQKRLVELQLRQAQKLESIGHLAAGIAHELNTPIQFVGDNINFLNDTFKDFISIFQACSDAIKKHSADGSLCDEDFAVIKNKFDDFDFEYLSTEIPSAFEQSQEGVKRISDIVRAMKDFSHPGSGERSGVDINKAIVNTVTVARNEWKYVAEVRMKFDETILPVPCYEGELKQVILNIIVNAAHAIGDVLKKNSDSSGKGVIEISTHADKEWAYIDISDTGGGIPDTCRNKVFDPFFTTKEPGRGTGQGLAISYDVIVNKHHGKISFDTEINKGTVFHICLPME